MSRQTLPLRAFALGLVCGMRSMLGPALIRPRLAAAREQNEFVTAAASPLAAALFPLAAAGEFVGDKLPITPNRTEIQSVIFRSGSGAAVGASLYFAEDEPIAMGVALGLIGALVTTYGCFQLRKTAGEKTHLPNLVLGLIEDSAALALGTAAARADS